MINDNCYYVTLAGLLRTTMFDLVQRTGINEQIGGAMNGHIAYLYGRAGLPIRAVYVFESSEALSSFVVNAPNLSSTPVGVALSYQACPSWRHMVALYVYRNATTGNTEGLLIDFQMSRHDGRRISFTLPQPPPYHLYDTYGLYDDDGNGNYYKYEEK
jgi:hypothetical protein